MRIGKVLLKNNVMLAPMAGVGDVGFRSVCRMLGAGLSFTEMVSAKGLLYKNAKTERLLATSPHEEPCAVQLFGSEPEVLAEACRDGRLSKFSIIDINMGCPVPKVFGNGEGCALMGDIRLAEKIISACVKVAGRPVTVKLRKGIDEASANAVEFARMCEGAGAAMVTVHGRLRTQMYRGKSDWQVIANVVKAVNIPVIANGDVFSREDAISLMEKTGAAGVMVARGALGNPFIFSQITGQQQPFTLRQAIAAHTRILAEYTGERLACLNMRKHLLWYLGGVRGGKAYKAKAAKVSSLWEIYSMLDEVFGDG